MRTVSGRPSACTQFEFSDCLEKFAGVAVWRSGNEDPRNTATMPMETNYSRSPPVRRKFWPPAPVSRPQPPRRYRAPMSPHRLVGLNPGVLHDHASLARVETIHEGNPLPIRCNHVAADEPRESAPQRGSGAKRKFPVCGREHISTYTVGKRASSSDACRRDYIGNDRTSGSTGAREAVTLPLPCDAVSADAYKSLNSRAAKPTVRILANRSTARIPAEMLEELTNFPGVTLPGQPGGLEMNSHRMPASNKQLRCHWRRRKLRL